MPFETKTILAFSSAWAGIGGAPQVKKQAAERVEEARDDKAEKFRKLLRQSGRRTLANIQVHVDDGIVVLSGKVDSYFLKQLAQEAIRQHAIGLRIHNCLSVQWPSRMQKQPPSEND